MSNLTGPFPSLSPSVPCGNSSPAHAPLRTLAHQANPADAFAVSRARSPSGRSPKPELNEPGRPFSAFAGDPAAPLRRQPRRRSPGAAAHSPDPILAVRSRSNGLH